MSDVHGKEIKVQNTTVKVPGRRPQLAKSSPQSGNIKVANDISNKTMNPAARSSKELFDILQQTSPDDEDADALSSDVAPTAAAASEALTVTVIQK